MHEKLVSIKHKLLNQLNIQDAERSIKKEQEIRMAVLRIDRVLESLNYFDKVGIKYESD